MGSKQGGQSQEKIGRHWLRKGKCGLCGAAADPFWPLACWDFWPMPLSTSAASQALVLQVWPSPTLQTPPLRPLFDKHMPHACTSLGSWDPANKADEIPATTLSYSHGPRPGALYSTVPISSTMTEDWSLVW